MAVRARRFEPAIYTPLQNNTMLASFGNGVSARVLRFTGRPQSRGLGFLQTV